MPGVCVGTHTTRTYCITVFMVEWWYGGGGIDELQPGSRLRR